MKYHRRPGSPLPYLLIAIASLLFAVAQPLFALAPESNAVALADIAWTVSTSQ